MAAEAPNFLQPRSTGEILDDAWRLYRADASALLLLSSLFLAPAFAALLWLLAHPIPSGLGDRLLWPLLTAALLCLTGIGSGACQDWLRRRLEGQALSLAACLGASLRRGLGHVSLRAIGLIGILLGLGCLLLPGLSLWLTLTPVHAALAGSRTGSLADIQVGREARFDAAKAAAVTLSRVPILLLALLNLVLLVQAGVWVAGNLAGLDVALLAVQLEPGNPVFLAAATLLAWLLLAPYFEASSFLLHLDTRIRQEGLDLLHRVKRVFAILALGLILFLPDGLAGYKPEALARDAPSLTLRACIEVVNAQDRAGLLEAVRRARAELIEVRQEVESADPYPGGQRWQGRLERLTRQVEQAQPGQGKHFSWLRPELDSFANRGQASAVEVLTDVLNRLAVVEDDLARAAPAEPRRAGQDEIKRLLRPRDEAGQPIPQRRQERPPKQEQARPDRQQEENAEQGEPVRRRQVGDGLLPRLAGGPGPVFWWVLAGVALAVLAALLWARRARKSEIRNPKSEITASEPGSDFGFGISDFPHRGEWFRKAEELARAGQFKEAVRALYHAVLSLLHRQQVLRWERTRTNGEYLRQVHQSANAPPGLAEPFERLTRRFERLWYGDREGTALEYSSCRELAEEIRQAVGVGQAF